MWDVVQCAKSVAQSGVSFTYDSAYQRHFLSLRKGYLTVESNVYFYTQLSITVWVKAIVMNSWARIIDFGRGEGVDNVFLGYTDGTSGKPVFGIVNSTSSAYTVSDTNLNIGQWAFVAATYDGTNGRIFINGLMTSFLALPVPDIVMRISNFIGKSNWAADGPADLDVFDVRIYNRALTESEIMSIMQN